MKMKEVAQLCPALYAPMDCGYQAPLSMGFSRQEYQSGLPFPSPGDLPEPELKPVSSALQAGSFLLCHWGSPLGLCPNFLLLYRHQSHWNKAYPNYPILI